MKIATLFAAVILGAALSSAVAQPEPQENQWDISKVDASKLPAPSTQADVTFAKDIQPLFKASCLRCHGADRPRGGLKLDSREGALKGGHDGKMIVSGDSAKSLLVAAVARISPRIAMPPAPRGRRPGEAGQGAGAAGAPSAGTPPTGSTNQPPNRLPPPPPLTSDQVALVRAWIDQGAK